ncbi:MAG: serine/threonine protein phosphatase PrpC [Candidatus Nanohaloarchaea archaeon]|jgi:serine/threonine protein phosphatase PrpC
MSEQPEIQSIIEAGSPDQNEDYLWIGPEEGVNAVLILDGTSGTEGDFGANEDLTGGQRYVQYFGEEVEKILEEEPNKPLEEVLKSAISSVWDRFEDGAEENVEDYFSGENVVLQRAETVPAAVGALVRWNKDELELLHVGDIEAYVRTEEGVETYSNETHEKFDELRDEWVEKYGKSSEEVREIVSKHRSAHNLPGTYPNMSFNPLAVEKLGVKKSYPREEVKRVVLSTDGGTARMKKLLELNEGEILAFLEEKGVKDALEKLREREENLEINALKKSDDAAIADLWFEK